MQYKGKKVALTGVQGFIGSALYRKLEEMGAYVNVLTGDIRESETFDGPTGLDYEHDYLLHFGAPSSQILFKRQPYYATETTIKGFLNAAKACREYGIKLIYPSTGLLSQGRMNEYAMCKRICEDVAIGENIDSIGFRIFATYGPGESHKRDYASVPYLFARDMVKGKAPVIFGDGRQTRDFIFIDDVVRGILTMSEESNEPTVELGSGSQTSFNDLVKEINYCLKADISPKYVDKPRNYVEETEAIYTYDNWQPEIGLTDGIQCLIDSLK